MTAHGDLVYLNQEVVAKAKICCQICVLKRSRLILLFPLYFHNDLDVSNCSFLCDTLLLIITSVMILIGRLLDDNINDEEVLISDVVNKNYSKHKYV